MIAARRLDVPLLRSLTAELERRGAVHSVETRRVAVRDAAGDGEVEVARWSVTLDDSDDSYGTQLLISLLHDVADRVAEQLEAEGQGEEALDGAAPVTTTVLPAGMRPEAPKMLLMDVDSTLIDQEVIELLARHAGREQEVAAVTERAMRGEIDFADSLHERVAVLAGLPLSVIDSTVQAVSPTCGAETLIGDFRRRRWPACAVSGGFVQVLDPLAARLGLSLTDANLLEVESGRLTGRVEGAVVDRAAKADRLRRWSADQGIPAASVVAVGDGANDLDMVTAAGVGVAFCAKPALAEHADLVIRHRSLELVGLALGLDQQPATAAHLDHSSEQ
ncbi:phosphoserine phosphatase SerB [Nesterenkonia xinjiangensis]|uniref:phosphoserine phosphatase n=1 Tax=Nesterenkonia xinjiangensis TaxID=225327 RepID=A0A7Z0GNT4_9MICC|nr:phosphoserine phosphatase SerB [Nesterenkonia xinjiangensis]NYJ79391.1 phosphoserine phosphatase [Nesterenkonia xinjiangensis]